MSRSLALTAVLVAACQGQGAEPVAGRGSGSAPIAIVADRAEPSDPPVGSGSGPDDTLPTQRPPKPEEEPLDPGKAIAALGAVPAWQTVIDRARYLGRRRQHGVVYGTLGPTVMMPAPPAPTPGVDAGVPNPALDAGVVASPYMWLIDDTEGHGSLAIRVALGAHSMTLKEGDRVALGGAWELDPDRRWYWKVQASDDLTTGAVHPLPALDPAKELKDPRPLVPGHVVVNGELPSGARTISLARDNDAVYFQIVGPPPETDGDGWAVADELGNPTFALLNLPGERASYGGQDMRTPDERWTLRRGVTYTVRIGKVRKKSPDKPATINARTAPIRVL